MARPDPREDSRRRHRRSPHQVGASPGGKHQRGGGGEDSNDLNLEVGWQRKNGRAGTMGNSRRMPWPRLRPGCGLPGSRCHSGVTACLHPGERRARIGDHQRRLARVRIDRQAGSVAGLAPRRPRGPTRNSGSFGGIAAPARLNRVQRPGRTVAVELHPRDQTPADGDHHLLICAAQRQMVARGIACAYVCTVACDRWV